METKYINIKDFLKPHLSKLQTLRNEFIQYALTTKRADRPKLEQAIANIYKFAGLKSPNQIIWLDSPLDAVMAVSLWIDTLNTQLYNEATGSLCWLNNLLLTRQFQELLPGIDAEPPEYTGLVRSLEKPMTGPEYQIRSSNDGTKEHESSWIQTIEHPLLGYDELRTILALVGQTIGEQLIFDNDSGNSAYLSEQLWLSPWNAVNKALNFNRYKWEECGKKLTSLSEEERTSHFLSLQIHTITQHLDDTIMVPLINAFPLAIHSFLESIGIEFKNVPPLMDSIKAGGWWWPFEEICFACDNPIELHVNANLRLHNENGMAIKFENGWGFWALSGVRVPESVVKNQFSAADIDAQENAQIRSLMIHRFGLSKYIVESGANEIDRDTYGILYRKIVPGAREPIIMVQVTNKTPEPDGTYKIYFLRVPPNIKTAKEAVAWTFDQEEHEYKPDQES